MHLVVNPYILALEVILINSQLPLEENFQSGSVEMRGGSSYKRVAQYCRVDSNGKRDLTNRSLSIRSIRSIRRMVNLY